GHLARALVGTEGSCVTVLAATVRLVEPPAARVLAVLGYPDQFRAADATPPLLAHHPLALEGIDAALVAAHRVARGPTAATGRRPAGPGCTASSAGPPRSRPERRPGARCGSPGCRPWWSPTRPGSARSGGCGRRAPGWPPGCSTVPRRTPGGRTLRSRPSASGRTCGTSPHCWRRAGGAGRT